MAPPSNLFVEPSYILSVPHMPAVEYCIKDLACRFTLLGRLDAARHFVELLYSRPLLQTLDWVGLRALVPYWRLTHFPRGMPEQMKTDAYFEDYMDSKQRKGVEWPHHVPKEQRTADEAGIDALLPLRQPVNDYYRILAYRSALEIAIKLAEQRNVDPASDAKVLGILAVIAKSFSSMWRNDQELIDSPPCHLLFMSGTLARAFDLSDQELDLRARELLEACRHRYWRGVSPPVSHDIPGLLQSCNDNSFAKSDDYWREADQHKPNSLYNPPATEEDILSLEVRLDISLPEDFKTFLRTSNGFGGIWNGYSPDPPLFSTKDIDWMDYSEYELRDDHLVLPVHVISNKDDAWKVGDEVLTPPVFSKVICIANEDIDHVWLLPPEHMQEVREYYSKLYDLVDEPGKRTIERSIEDFAGSWDEWEKLEWGCTYWAAGGSALLNHFKSFTGWLQDAAWSAENITDDS